MSETARELPVVQAYVMIGQDDGRLVIERCPHCGRVHTHEAGELDRPRTCGKTLQEYMLLPPEPPGVARIVRR